VAKQVMAQVKIQIPGGQARPAPPVGPALGQHGVQIMEFCKQFNAATSDRQGDVIPVVITIYDDKSFTFVLKTPPTAVLIKKELGIQRGSDSPKANKVAKITTEQLRKIAEIKLPDLNTKDIDQAIKIVAGSARQMGIDLVD
jgi:large subunit ribosomal protein L11